MGTGIRGYREEDGEEQLHSVQGVEVFRVGKWNGDTYSKADLDEMVTNFNRVGFQVPVKLGHKEVSGGPAYGWVEKIRRVGDKLVADFRDLPTKLWKALKTRRFDSVSSEVFWDLERNGKKFSRVLKAVALLGGETPAVSGLAPLRTVVNSQMPPVGGFGRMCAYSFDLSNRRYTMDDDKMGMDPDELQDHIDELEEKLLEAKAKRAKAKVSEQKENRMTDQDGLQTKVDLLHEQISEATAAIAAAVDKLGSGDEAEAAKAASDLKAAQGQIETLKADLGETVKQMKAIDRAKSDEVKALTQQVAGLTDRISEMSEVRRKERINQKVGEVPIPALRRFMEPLYDVASSTAKVAKYSAKDGEVAKDTSVEAILDDMVGFLKSESAKLFRELSEANIQERSEGNDFVNYNGDPSAEVDKRARTHMDKTGTKDYKGAVRHVLADDSKLKAAYASFTTGRAKH